MPIFGALRRTSGDVGEDLMLPTVPNLAPCPRLGRAAVLGVNSGDPEAYANGAVYLHVHARRASTPPDRPGLFVEGVGTNTDTHLAPGGRHGGLRLGLQPGKIYTCSVDVILDDRLSGALTGSRLSIAPGCVVHGTTRWAYSSSLRAPNEPGTYRLSTTFRVPADATDAWVRLICGMTGTGGIVGWDRFQLTPTMTALPYFDGDTPDDRWYTYNWSGEPDSSASIRTVRPPAESWPEPIDLTGSGEPPVLVSILTEIERRTGVLLIEESELLAAHLDNLRSGRYEHLAKAAGLLIAEARSWSDGFVSGETTLKPGTKTTTKLTALAENSNSPAIAAIAGRRLSQRRAWEAAVAPLRIAAASGADVRDSYRLAFALEQIGQRAEIAELVRSAAAREQQPPFDVRKAASIDVNRFAPRYEVGCFLAEHLAEIQDRAERTHKLFIGGLGELPVFSYWGQGYDHAPPVVTACRQALERLNPASQLHFIDNRSLPYYADFPDSLLKVSADQPALFSDALRVDLLARYGGIWLDATCLTTAPLTASAQDLVRPGFFAFNYTESRISSWFMAARPDSRIVAMLRAALLTWFDHGMGLVDYYLIHHIFEMLYRLDPGFTAEWDRGVRLGSRPPHKLQLMMYDDADRGELQAVLGSSFIHKLTHKLNRQYREGQISPYSGLAEVIRSAGAGLPADPPPA